MEMTELGRQWVNDESILYHSAPNPPPLTELACPMTPDQVLQDAAEMSSHVGQRPAVGQDDRALAGHAAASGHAALFVGGAVSI